MNKPPEPSSKLGDSFDAAIRSLDGLPDVVKTRPTTMLCVHPILGIAQTFIVQTYRQAERGDTILVQYVGAEGSFRVALPPDVAEAIGRQHDALSTKNRKKGAAQAVETRAERGIEPGFLKRKGG